jgi:hypothetical protein
VAEFGLGTADIPHRELIESYFALTMQRPRRARRAIVFHDDRLANEEEYIKKKRLEASKKRRTNPHIPVPVEPLPDIIQSNALPAFISSFRIEYESFAYSFALSSPLSIFMLFCTNAYLIGKTKNGSLSHRDHTKFFDTLVDELLAIPLESELPNTAAKSSQ